MNTQVESASTERLLACLDLAIDEAKLVRLIIKSKDMAYKLKTQNPFSQSLVNLNREIAHLETKLMKFRSEVKRKYPFYPCYF